MERVKGIVGDAGWVRDSDRAQGQLVRFKESVELEAMAAIKRALDPKMIMNPGKSSQSESETGLRCCKDHMA